MNRFREGKRGRREVSFRYSTEDTQLKKHETKERRSTSQERNAETRKAGRKRHSDIQWSYRLSLSRSVSEMRLHQQQVGRNIRARRETAFTSGATSASVVFKPFSSLSLTHGFPSSLPLFKFNVKDEGRRGGKKRREERERKKKREFITVSLQKTFPL